MVETRHIIQHNSFILFVEELVQVVKEHPTATIECSGIDEERNSGVFFGAVLNYTTKEVWEDAK